LLFIQLTITLIQIFDQLYLFQLELVGVLMFSLQNQFSTLYRFDQEKSNFKLILWIILQEDHQWILIAEILNFAC
jgi:hypothetical protein